MENVSPIFSQITDRKFKEKILKQRGVAIWLIGLSGAGKSTIAIALEKKLLNSGFFTILLDGDNVRHGLNSNLGFSTPDRQENIRRAAEVARLLINNGIVTICSFITPAKEMRQVARSIVGVEDFVEVFVNCPLAVCEERDVKGLYKKARKGDVKNFTGLGSEFMAPENPDIELCTDKSNIEECVNTLYNFLLTKIKHQESQ